MRERGHFFFVFPSKLALPSSSLSRPSTLTPLSLFFLFSRFFFLPSFPFLLVDRVVELVPQKYAVGYKVRTKVFLLKKMEREKREKLKSSAKRPRLKNPEKLKN